jgi:galactose-1-phosphate uridylyltransferase
MKKYRCAGCNELFPRGQIWFLPYTGQRCTRCAMDFLAYYKDHSTPMIIKMIRFTTLQKMKEA